MASNSSLVTVAAAEELELLELEDMYGALD